MASSSGIRAGQAYVELLADDSKLRAGLASAQKQLAAWGAQIRHVGLAVFAAGAGMLAPLLAATKQFASSGDALAKMAVRTGLTVELLSELKHAASVSGTSLEDLEKASRRLSVTITSAMRGNQAALTALGGTTLTKELAKLTPDQQFLAVARAIGQIPDPTRRAAAAVAVFGRTGTMLLPLIAEMDHLRNEAHKLGAVMSTEQAQKAMVLQDAWERIEGAFARIIKAIGTALAPALTRLAGEALPVLVTIKRWIANNEAVVISIAKIGAVLAAAGGTIIAFAGAITGLAWVFKGLGMAVDLVTGTFRVLRLVFNGITGSWSVLTTALSAIGAGLRTLVGLGAVGSAAMATLRAGTLALALAMGSVGSGSAIFAVLPGLIGLAVNPVTVLGAAIIGLGAYLYQTSDGGRQALSQLGQAFAEVQDDAVTAFSAISDALSAGDIMGSVKILWSFIQLEWTRGVAWVENFMQAFAGGVAKIFLNVGFGINTAFWTVVYGIQGAIEWVVAGIARMFTTVIGGIASKIAYLLELVGALDEGTSQKITDLSANMNSGIEKIRASRMAERDQKMNDFKGLWDEKVQGVNQWMAQGMQGRDAEIAAKRAELDAAIAAAREARTTAGGKDKKGDGIGAMGGFETDTPQIPELDTAALSAELSQRMSTVQLKVDTLGMFNASAIGELGVGGTAVERGLQAQEKTARNTERIMNAVENDELTFE